MSDKLAEGSPRQTNLIQVREDYAIGVCMFIII